MSASPFRRTIRLRSVARAYRAGAGSCLAEVSALDDATLEIRAGEVVILSGPQGSGKTTLLLCAAGLLRCDTGMIDRGLPTFYRDVSRCDRLEEWPPDAALFLDSIDRVAVLGRDALAAKIQAALVNRCAVVLAGRDAESCLSLAPPEATISVVHMRVGRIALPSSAAVHRVAEGVSARRRG